MKDKDIKTAWKNVSSKDVLIQLEEKSGAMKLLSVLKESRTGLL